MTRSLLVPFRSAIALGLACLLLSGCGGSNANGPQKPGKVIQSPQIPANLNAVPAAPPQQQAVAPKPDPGAKAAKASKPKLEEDPFADEDPKNRFEIAGEQPTTELGSASEAAQIDRFTVGELAPGTSSADFEIAAVAGKGAKAGSTETAKNAAFQLPSGFSEAAGGYSDDGLPIRIRHDKTEALMALVPAGAARVGSIDGPPETQPTFSPFLETYYMDVTEVTLAQYKLFRDDIKQKKNTRGQSAANDGQNPELPALGLPWAVAQGFAHWAGKELPTEAEFENAARGPHGWRSPWGDTRAVWPRPRTPETITPVASFPTDQSLYGIYDLAGNAREWCADHYSDTAHQEAESAKEKTLRNWSGPKKASVSGQRVVKGNGPDWAAWHREGRAAAERHPDVGFRCVLRVKVPASDSGKGD